MIAYYAIWVILLFMELSYFNGLTHRVHGKDSVLFIMTVIFVTLVVGASGASKIKK